MPESLLAVSESMQDAFIDDLRVIAGLDSFSYDKADIDRVQDWLSERLSRVGFSVDRRRNERWGDDLVARRRDGGRGRVMLLGHADTVYPAGTAAARPIRIEGDKLLGPGTCDMKAGLLTGIYAVEALDRAGGTGLEEITLVVVSDEEIEERHSVELIKFEGPRHHAALTLEAARENGDIVTSRKATRWWKVEAQGKAAHAGVEPEKGASATLAIANIIVEAFKLNGLKPGMTINPGRITGGANPNIVADYASVMFDLRAWSNSEMEELSDALRVIVESAWVAGVTTSMSMDGGPGMPAMERSPGTMRLENHAIRIANDLGFPLKGAATGGGSDISHAVHAGTPGLDGLGPIGGLDHSPDEYISIQSIAPRIALLAELLRSISADEELTRDDR